MYETDSDYQFPDPKEKPLLQFFVFNEVIVGAVLLIQMISVICCGAISKSQHLNEIEGEGFGVDMD